MVKNKPKKIDRQGLFNIVIATSVILLAFTMFIGIRDMHEAFQSHVQIDFLNSRDIASKYTTLEFCYERTIRPCDNTTLEAWNAAHPDDKLVDLQLK